MKHINRIRRPDGSVQLYLRKPGCPSLRLPDGLDPEALQGHVDDLVARLEDDPAYRPPDQPGPQPSYVNGVRRRDGSIDLYLRKTGLPRIRLPEGLNEPELRRHVTGLIAELEANPSAHRAIAAAHRQRRARKAAPEPRIALPAHLAPRNAEPGRTAATPSKTGVRYVSTVRRPDGATYLYLRKRGLPSVRLPDGLSQAELQRHVDALLAELQPPAPAPKPDLRGALREYELRSPDFAVLAPSTKYEYRRVLKELEEDLGRVQVAAFTPSYVNRLKALWARRGHRAANVRLQILKNVLKPALLDETLKVDPFPLVGAVRRPRTLPEPHLVWPDAVFERVMAELQAQERYGLARALAVARFVGARRGDLVRIPLTARSGGRFAYVSGKRQVRVDIPEDARLSHWLDRLPAAPPVSVRLAKAIRRGAASAAPATIVFNRMGKPYTEDGLGQELAKVIADLHAQRCIDGKRYDLHGLRHTRGVELALAGCSDAEGAALMGHGSPVSFVQYRRQADKTRLSDAGAARLNGAVSGQVNDRHAKKLQNEEVAPSGATQENQNSLAFSMTSRWYRPPGSNGRPPEPQSGALTN